MQVRLLGPVDLEVDDLRLEVGGRQAQSVLALLATRAGEVVTADWLIDQLWGRQPPRSARVALQSYISRLRALHEPATGRMLPRRPHGYLLDTAAAEVDSRVFARQSERGRAALADGQWPTARRELTAAARLWRGRAFTAIDEVPALAAERSRLESLRVETRFAELHAVLECDGPAEVLAPLRELVAEHRWDERGWRLLALALYRGGRQTEALDVLARARRLLVDEHGLDPSPVLTDLERRILVHDRTLDPVRPPARSPSRFGVTPPLVGRDGELASLLATWSATAEGRGAAVAVVRGEPGVGKSHLVARFAQEVQSRGGTVLLGRCRDEPRMPLQPWPDVLPDIERLAVAAGQPGAGHPMVDVWELTAHRLFVAVGQVVGDALAAGPAMLVVEDVHWAGAAALRLLDHVLVDHADRPLLVVATVRSTGARMPPDAQGAMGAVVARTRSQTVELTGLNAADLQAMLAARGHRVTAADSTAVWHRTGGIPLLAVEALRGGQDVLAARLGQVGAPAVELAELLAVLGDGQPLALLGAAAGCDEEALAAQTAELESAGLVRPSTGAAIAYEFSHALYREALLDRLPELRRLVLSRRVLAAADALPGLATPPLRARNALVVSRSGLPSDVRTAGQACGDAGRWATLRCEHAEAVRWWGTAGELAHRDDPEDPDGPDDRSLARLEMEYGLACRRAGHPTAREAFLRAASRAGAARDHVLQARIGLAWSRGFFNEVGGVDTALVRLLRAALHPDATLPKALRARATAALAAELTWDPAGEERFALADAALELARSTGEPATVAAVLATRNLTIAAADTLDVRRRDTEELMALSDALGDVGLRFDAVFHRCGPAIEDGDVGLIEELLAEAGQVADLLRQPALQWTIGWSRASLMLWQGALPAAEKLARESAEQGSAAGHASEARMFFGAHVLELRRLQGKLDELVPLLEAVPAARRDGFSTARYLVAAGRADAVDAHLADLRIVGGRLQLRRDMLERPALDDLAFVAARRRRPELAAALRHHLEPLADTFGHGVVAHPVGHHWLGVLALATGQPAAAVAHLRRAAARHAELELPLMAAESLIELARAHSAAGEGAAAGDARASALRLAVEHGAAGLVAEAHRTHVEGRHP